MGVQARFRVGSAQGGEPSQAWGFVRGGDDRVRGSAALLLADLEHGEPRIVAIGTSNRQRVLFVVSVEIDEDLMRIVSARKATASERKSYEEDE
jgi:Ribonuclease toxin, BrnT, of type II toxin-antitoxin system